MVDRKQNSGNIERCIVVMCNKDPRVKQENNKKASDRKETSDFWQQTHKSHKSKNSTTSGHLKPNKNEETRGEFGRQMDENQNPLTQPTRGKQNKGPVGR